MHGKNANSLENKLGYISGYLEVKLLDFFPAFEVNCGSHSLFSSDSFEFTRFDLIFWREKKTTVHI